MFGKLNVLNKVELQARESIYFEQYNMKINVEANLVERMSQTFILPAAIRYQTELAKNIARLKAAGVAGNMDNLEKVTHLISSLVTAQNELKEVRNVEHEDEVREATYFSQTVIPAMLKVREIADELEVTIADDLWPLPNYTEMLFIK